jgi:hypothetical protein
MSTAADPTHSRKRPVRALVAGILVGAVLAGGAVATAWGVTDGGSGSQAKAANVYPLPSMTPRSAPTTFPKVLRITLPASDVA